MITALIFMGCSDKSASVQKLPETKKEIKVVQEIQAVKEAKVPEVVQTIEVKKEVLRTNETLVEEPKVMKNIASDVPTSCAMWSDGSNICTRASSTKASCTTNPVENRMFSCLQWQ